MNHGELTKHIRNRIKKTGISASVRKMTICGHKIISVATSSYDQQFSLDDQKAINTIAKVNGLTLSRGMEIVEETPFGNEQEFVMP